MTLPKSDSPLFYSSRRRHTRWPRDWSSDVCSSDLVPGLLGQGGQRILDGVAHRGLQQQVLDAVAGQGQLGEDQQSHAVVVRLLRRRADLCGVAGRVGKGHRDGAGSHPDEVVAVDAGERAGGTGFRRVHALSLSARAGQSIRVVGMSQQTPDAPAGPVLPPVGSGKRVRVHHLTAAKAAGERLTMLTAYDAPTARLFDEAGIDLLLVGDSIGDNMRAHENTLPVTLAEMLPPALGR